MNRKEFEDTLAKARTEDERLSWFGALLTRESKLDGQLIIVGGSAIEIYLTSNEYVSMDIDVVGEKAAISAVLRRWGFQAEKGRDRRIYWVKKGLGNVDLVGPRDRSGLPPRAFPTPYRRRTTGCNRISHPSKVDDGPPETISGDVSTGRSARRPIQSRSRLGVHPGSRCLREGSTPL